MNDKTETVRRYLEKYWKNTESEENKNGEPPPPSIQPIVEDTTIKEKIDLNRKERFVALSFASEDISAISEIMNLLVEEVEEFSELVATISGLDSNVGDIDYIKVLNYLFKASSEVHGFNSNITVSMK